MNGYRLDDGARRDVDSIYDYIAQRNPTAADRLIDLLWAKFEFLARHPLSGELRKDVSDEWRSFAAGRYVIFYRVVDDAIDVARVLHSSRDLGSALSEDTP